MQNTTVPVNACRQTDDAHITRLPADVILLFNNIEMATGKQDRPYFSAFYCLIRTERLITQQWIERANLVDNSEEFVGQLGWRGLMETQRGELLTLQDILSVDPDHSDKGTTIPVSTTLKDLTARLKSIRSLNDKLAMRLPVEECRKSRIEARALRISCMSNPEDLCQLENLCSLASALSGDPPLHAPAVRASDLTDFQPFDDAKHMKKAGRRVTRYLVRYRKSAQQSLLEYKYYAPEYADGDEGSTIFDRVQHLAAVLHSARPARLRVLQCIGVFEEPQNFRFGLLHKLPPRTHRHLGQATLLKHLNSKWKPSLTDRIELARKLAHCALELHSVGWLHKNIRSENIVFFHEEDSTRRRLDTPYLIGMECSRPDHINEISEETPV